MQGNHIIASTNAHRMFFVKLVVAYIVSLCFLYFPERVYWGTSFPQVVLDHFIRTNVTYLES